MGEKAKNLYLIYPLFAVLFVVGLGAGRSALAATQFFSPSGGSYSAQASFTVSVYTTSADQAASAFSGQLSFPPDKLNVTSVSKAGSIISFWVQEPIYSNTAGTISFEGFIPNPGYTGLGGKLITVTFTAKGAGSANLAFLSGSILANDGLGTDITSGLGTAIFTLGDQVPVLSPAVTSGRPSAATVSSSSHPDESSWYTNNQASFAWTVPTDVTGVNFLANQNPSADPGTQSDGLVSTHTYTDVDDGLWYFHLRLQNQHGWGGVSHFTFRIDTLPPAPFEILQLDPDTLVAEPTIDFLASDAISGIDYYAVSVDGRSVATLVPGELVPGIGYRLPRQTLGQHTVTVTAFDLASNSQSASLVVNFAGKTAGLSGVQPISLARIIAVTSLVLKFIILLIFTGLILAALVFVLIMVARLISSHAGQAVQLVSGWRPRYLRHVLRSLRRDTRKHLQRLENARQMRDLPVSAERTIRATASSLHALEAKITRSLEDL